MTRSFAAHRSPPPAQFSFIASFAIVRHRSQRGSAPDPPADRDYVHRSPMRSPEADGLRQSFEPEVDHVSDAGDDRRRQDP